MGTYPLAAGSQFHGQSLNRSIQRESHQITLLRKSTKKPAKRILPSMLLGIALCRVVRLLTWVALLSGLFLWPSGAQASVSDEFPQLVISELHYKPEPVTEWSEFVEIHNPGDEPFDLSGWLLDGGVTYLFPSGSVIAPGGYMVIAQNADAFAARFGQVPSGQFSGKLSNDGERIILRSDKALVVDEVSYQLGFPWPTVGAPPSNSIQLIHPSLDNAQPGAWRSGSPSPGSFSPFHDENAPPFIDGVSHSPKQPTSNMEVTISARVDDVDGVADVFLLYQIVAPGAYVAQHDSAYASNWTPVAMTRLENGQWQTVLPASLQQHRHLVRYRIHARDSQGYVLTVPYADDPQPNFAYFVYDGMPQWTSSANGRSDDWITFDFNQMRPLPVYHFIAKKLDVADALFMPPSERSNGYMGSDYLWRGTLVYDGTVYDHVNFRARGGETRYATGKNMWKIDFHAGHRFQAHDDYGRPYDMKWDKLNLSAVIQQTHRGHRGEQGMFESSSFRLFNLADVQAPLTNFAHLRVIDERSEIGANQFQGDFWGLYLAVEQMDGQFLKQHDLPDGNLYKMEINFVEKNNQGSQADPTMNDIANFLTTFVYSTPSDDWWRANFDLEDYYSYRAILEMIHHYDVDERKNYFYFNDPDTRKWSVFPWDLDLTWSNDMPGVGNEPFRNRVLSRPDFQIGYQNRVRELRDLLFNPEQMTMMLDEHAGFINSSINGATNGATMVQADRHMWDFNPIYLTDYIDPNRTRWREFYKASPTGDFPGMVVLMKRWVNDRSKWIDQNILTDVHHPRTPGALYGGPPGFPADQLQFYADGFQDPQGVDTFAAMKWRVAEVTNPAGPVFDSAEPRIYEIESIAESDELTDLSAYWPIPNGVLKPLHTYRVRVRMKDNSGRWSHWSPPIQFVAGMPSAAPETNLALTEIMYNPPSVGPRDGDDFEFIELTNMGSGAIDLSNYHFTEGIEYRFPIGSRLEAGKRLILASDRSAFGAMYDTLAFDEYRKHLSNSGEQLTLVDAYGRTIVSLAYDDEEPWPEAADGGGYSLVLDDETGDDQEPNHWRLSTMPNGSPGTPDPRPVFINELLSNPAIGQRDEVELYNPNDRPVDISHWFLSDDLVRPDAYQIAVGTVVPANGYLTLTSDQVIPGTGLSSPLNFDALGGQIYLFSASAENELMGYRHGFAYGASEQGISLGRLVTTDGREHFVQQQQLTLGRANEQPLVGPIVISEIHPHPAKGDEYLELTNNSDQPVKLYEPLDPQQTWRIDGLLYEFPPGIEIPAGGSLLVVPSSPTEACLARTQTSFSMAEAHLPATIAGDNAANDAERDEPQVVGPYGVRLAASSQSLSLLKPIPTGNLTTRAYVIIDQVDYDDDWPWPVAAAGSSAALRRVDLNGFGNEPTNWQEVIVEETVFSADALSPRVGLCAFEAFVRSDADDVGDSTGNDVSDEGNAETIEIHWVSHTEENVVAYRLWRSDSGSRDDAQRIDDESIVALGTDGKSAHYQFVDSKRQDQGHITYWLEAVSEVGVVGEVAFTRSRQPISHSYLPVVVR
jgi:hypothetical protein